MSFVQDKKIGFGEALSGTIEVLVAAKREVAIYCVIFATLAGLQAASDMWFQQLSLFINLGVFALYFYAQSRLYQVLLRNSGISLEDRIRPFSFLGMAVLIGISLYFAVIFFVIPAIILGAKWIMAPSVLVAEKRGIISAMGDSWNASSGNTLMLSLAYAVIFLIWFIILAGAGALSDVSDFSNGRTYFTDLSFHILSILMMGLSVSAYRKLHDGMDELTSVFE